MTSAHVCSCPKVDLSDHRLRLALVHPTALSCTLIIARCHSQIHPRLTHVALPNSLPQRSRTIPNMAHGQKRPKGTFSTSSSSSSPPPQGKMKKNSVSNPSSKITVTPTPSSRSSSPPGSISNLLSSSRKSVTFRDIFG